MENTSSPALSEKCTKAWSQFTNLSPGKYSQCWKRQRSALVTEGPQKQWEVIYWASSWILRKCFVFPFPASMPGTYLPSGWKSTSAFWIWLSRGLFYKLESSPCSSQCTRCLERSVCTWEEGKQCFGLWAFHDSVYMSWELVRCSNKSLLCWMI